MVLTHYYPQLVKKRNYLLPELEKGNSVGHRGNLLIESGSLFEKQFHHLGKVATNNTMTLFHLVSQNTTSGSVFSCSHC